MEVTTFGKFEDENCSSQLHDGRGMNNDVGVVGGDRETIDGGNPGAEDTK